MNPKLQGLAQQAAEIIAAHIKEKEDEILEAWAGVSAQASEDEKTPVLRLGFSIALDLDANKACYKTSFAVRRTIETAAEIPDPNQTEFEAVKGVKGAAGRRN